MNSVRVVLLEANEGAVISEIASAATVLGQDQVHPSGKALVLVIIQCRLFMGVDVVVTNT
jgi:hypothetical protein